MISTMGLDRNEDTEPRWTLGIDMDEDERYLFTVDQRTTTTSVVSLDGFNSTQVEHASSFVAYEIEQLCGTDES
jgi:hypothetical protein